MTLSDICFKILHSVQDLTKISQVLDFTFFLDFYFNW